MIDAEFKEDLKADWRRFLIRQEETMMGWIEEFLEDYVNVTDEEIEEVYDMLSEDILRRFPEIGRGH